MSNLLQLPTRPKHQPWCTDHLEGNADGWSEEEFDSCCSVAVAVPSRDGRGDLAVTISQDPGDLAATMTVASYGQPLTVDEAEALCAVLRAQIDRVKGLGS